MERDHGAMSGLEHCQGLVDELAACDLAGQIRSASHLDGLERDLDDPPAAPADLVEAGMNRQSVEPGVEPLRVPEDSDVPPGADEGFLDRIARELAVPDDQPCGRVQSRERRVDERGKG